jgi:Mg-chelatase subunit ChlI
MRGCTQPAAARESPARAPYGLVAQGAAPPWRRPLPQVELPLGATEDRICGTIDIEKALTQGIKAYEPGLLVRCAPTQRPTHCTSAAPPQPAYRAFSAL